MKPVLAFRLHDPDGTMFPHLQTILTDLKHERENSREETQKRQADVLPIAELLVRFSKDGKP